MRPPARIKKWLTTAQLSRWVHKASDRADRTRRRAIWLTHCERLHAKDVAEELGVSVQAVRLWVRWYNEGGPSSLSRKGQGGRRWAFMTQDEEQQVLAPFLRQARQGSPPRTSMIHAAVEEHLGKSVSVSYIYRLLRRHDWSTILARSHAAGVAPAAPGTFDNLSKPWQRSV